MPNAESLKAVVREYYSRLDREDLEGALEVISPDLEWRFSGVADAVTIETLPGNIRSFHDGFPESSHRIDRQTVEGDWVTTLLTMSGVHKGEFMGVAPTGRRIEVQGINMHQIRDGKIVGGDTVVDMLSLMQQIGG